MICSTNRFLVYEPYTIIHSDWYSSLRFRVTLPQYSSIYFWILFQICWHYCNSDSENPQKTDMILDTFNARLNFILKIGGETSNFLNVTLIKKENVLIHNWFHKLIFFERYLNYFYAILFAKNKEQYWV